VLDENDFLEAAPEKNKIIEVNHFVMEKEIDPIYFENSYFIEPEKSGEKAYALLYEALSKSGKVGVAQFVMRTAETIVVLKPYGKILLLCKIRFAEEIRDASEINVPSKSKVKPDELKMALSLIDQYTGKFDIEKFKDEYSASLMRIIKAKAKGKRMASHPLKVVHNTKSDLMDQLKASLHKKKAS
jgi:DNA end-binding protein Ku